MNRLSILSLGIWAGMLAVALPGRAEEVQLGGQLSPERLDLLDKRGYFTPAFKKAVHDLVEAKKEVVDAKVEEKKLEDEVPDLQKEANTAEDKVGALRQQFDALNHIDESEFTELQKKMADASVPLEEQRILAQAYVWGYPASPHQADAQKYLADVQKKIADQAQAVADAEAKKKADHAALVQRAIAKDLSISEWRDLLLTMSKEDLIKFIGNPQGGNDDDWTYAGGWTVNVITHQKVGMDVTFNAGRVINVTETAH
jgi:hypothetical protein